jgi:hypothetical protein
MPPVGRITSPSGSVVSAPLSCTRQIRHLGYRSASLETHGPLGTLWVGLGLCGFYVALVWINTLLGFVLTPLFIVPLTWLQDRIRGKAPARG